MNLLYAQGAVARFFDSTFEGLTGFLGSFLLRLVGGLLTLAGVLFDAAVEHLVVNMGDFVASLGTIDATWTVFRDFANIFFIFILLWAAISTILSSPNFNTKKVVTMLVIVALLINFSLFITQAVADVSNILALQFYNATTVVSAETGKQAGISEAFMQALKIPTLWNVQASASSIADTNGYVTIPASLFVLVTAFIFFAGALLLVIRFVILVALMVFAPFGFLALILPQTKKISDMYWYNLLKQSFFAPVFLALIYFGARVVNDPAFQSRLFGNLSNQIADPIKATGGVTMVLNFLIVAAIMIAALVISQKMGAVGADKTLKWGKDKGRAAGIWTGNKLKGAGLAPIRATGRGITAKAGKAGEKFNKSEGRVASALKRTPLVGAAATAGAAKAAAKGRAQISEKQKKYKDYDTAAKKSRAGVMGTTTSTRAALVKDLAKEKDLTPEGNLTRDMIIKSVNELDARGEDTKDIMQNFAQFADKEKIAKYTVKEGEEEIEKTMSEAELAIRGEKKVMLEGAKKAVSVPSINKDNVAKLDTDTFFDTEDEGIRNAMYETFHGGHMNAILDDNEKARPFIENLKKDSGARTVDELREWLTKEKKNPALANWAKKQDGRNALEVFGGFGSGGSSSGGGSNPGNNPHINTMRRNPGNGSNPSAPRAGGSSGNDYDVDIGGSPK